MAAAKSISPEPLPHRLISVMLPREHGSWSLALEPIALGVVAAPSAAGVILCGAALAAFFLRRPAKLVLTSRSDPRWGPALGCTVALGAGGLTALAVAAFRTGAARLWPLALAVPPGLAFVWWDSRGEGREAAAELAGAVAFAAVPAAMAALAGWPPWPALALAAVMAGRSVPTVLTVRAYLRRAKGQAVRASPAVAASVVAVVVAGVLVGLKLAPWAAVLAAGLLAMRAAILLGSTRLRIRATRLGIAEAILGGILVLMVALSWSR